MNDVFEFVEEATCYLHDLLGGESLLLTLYGPHSYHRLNAVHAVHRTLRVRGLDTACGLWYSHTMKTMIDTLRKAIGDSGLSDLRLGELAGVNRQSIARFMRGETSLYLEPASKLAAYLELELRPVDKAKKKGVK
jgi:hypothetical protein